MLSSLINSNYSITLFSVEITINSLEGRATRRGSTGAEGSAGSDLVRAAVAAGGVGEQVSSARSPGGACGGSRGLNPWRARETVKTKHFGACLARLVGGRWSVRQN